MNRRRGFGLLWGIVTLLIVGLVAAVAYQAGLSAQLATAGGTYVVAPHLVGLGFGFAFFWLLPILFFLLIAFRVFRGGRRWYGRGWYGARGMYDRGYRDVPPIFDQWHQKAHGQAPAEAPRQDSPAQTTPPPPGDEDPWR
jgi:hypothetical protein